MATRTEIVGLKAFNARLRKMEDFTRARVALHKRLTVIWRDAGEAFIRAAIRRVLVQTGMSAASFFPLSRAIKRIKAEADVRARVAERGRLKSGIPELPSGQRRPGIQGPRAGEVRGKEAFIFNTGNPKRYNFRFSFQTVVFQHDFFEFQQESLLIGIQAFQALVESKLGINADDILEEWLQGRTITSRIK